MMEFMFDVEAQYEDSRKGPRGIIRRGELTVKGSGVHLLKPVKARLMETCPALAETSQGRTFLLQALEGGG
jgi:hypothetical protein